MRKFIVAFGFVLVLLAVVEAQKKPAVCRPVCRKHVHSDVICAADKLGQHCHRIRACTMVEENCRRRLAHMSLLHRTNAHRCKYIDAKIGVGRCAPIRKPRSIRCDKKCSDKGSVRCYRSRSNNCRLLTECEWRRENCRRGSKNHLIRADRYHCAGIKRGRKGHCQKK